MKSFKNNHKKYIGTLGPLINLIFQYIDSIKSYISYIKSFMGDHILINSRYPIQSNKLKKSSKSLKINKQEFDEKAKGLMLFLNRLNTYYAFEKILNTWLDVRKDIKKENFEIELVKETEEFFIKKVFL